MKGPTSSSGVKELLPIWSPLQQKIAIPAVAADKSGPSIVVPSGYLGGKSVVRAELMMKYRKLLDTSAVANKLDGDQDVQVKESVAGTLTTGISLKDDMMSVAASAESGGDMIIGDADIKAEVYRDGLTYAVQITAAHADGANLELHDVEFGIRFYVQ